ncbi:hypothetical protein [Alkalibacillus almallahensis]|uniref:hypothetical protein n=1 Tax=Alkalibacillus almallahensis TaxID=1379154 RepID=UPI0014224A19|nr:hypothetical protein [Alkalibacillus almallahensis]NIK10901.1 hypothetical protein [Alkalibacillus almallahensis]
MTARSKMRGHDIEYTNGQWVYSDTKEPTCEVGKQNQNRECGYCGSWATPEGHDACLGTLIGTMNACCGHGRTNEAYVQLLDGTCIRGQNALELAEILRKRSD